MWQPRLAPGQPMPVTLEEWYALATSPNYADSGIQGHLAYMRSLVEPRQTTVVELGMGGGDQSTLAWMAAKPYALYCYDLNIPPSLPILQDLAAENEIDFEFFHGDTATSEIRVADILLVDSLHDYDTVVKELARFAPHCTQRIVAHDVLSFGRVGQFRPNEDQGINCAFLEFMMNNPEWQIENFAAHDNGLLTLKRI